MGDKLYVAERQKDDTFVVKKFEDGEESAEQYTINKAGGCNCPGYKYRKACRHTRFMQQFDDAVTASVSMSEARKIVDMVVDALGPFLDEVDEAEFEKEGSKVKMARISGISSTPLAESKHLIAVVQGLWVEVNIT